MKVLIVGAKGMLAHDVVQCCQLSGMQVIGLDLPELDITKADGLSAGIPSAEWIVNCAAFTRVDDCETERDAAFAVNGEGARNLAVVANERGMRLLHISTDYVFDGRAGRPVEETDRTNPLSVYGASKLAGEKAIRAEGGRHLIVRTQSLFGKHGHNFVKAIVRKARASDEPLRVVDDQISAPTYTRHLAEALVRLMHLNQEGVMHVTASGSCSWYEFARQIVAEIKPGHEVIPISAADLKLPATRPMFSILSNQRYQSMTGHRLPEWRHGLEAYFQEEDYFTT